MHRIDTSTAQTDKFGPGKNGFTNGDPATGRRATDLNSDMWDAVQEEICSVIEKSGIVLDKEQHDQLYQAIGKMIAAKIPDVLLRKNNLSDVADRTISLNNLNGVPKSTSVNGHALSGNINVTTQDIFNTQAISLNEEDINNLQTAGVYFQSMNVNASSARHYPENSAGALIVYKNAGLTQIYYVYNSSRIWSRAKYSTGEWTPWALEYNTQNKPSAGDVDAVSASQGGTFRGSVSFLSGLMINKGYPGLSLTDSSAANNLIGKNVIIEQTNGSLYIAFRKDGGSDGQIILNFPKVTGTLYSTGNKPNAGDVGAYSKSESDNRYQLKNSVSKAINGWFKDASTGLIKAWGFASVSDNSVVTVNLPITFPGACVNLQVTARSQNGNSSDNVLSAYGKIISNSQIRVSVCANWESHGADGVYFCVEGY